MLKFKKAKQAKPLATAVDVEALLQEFRPRLRIDRHALDEAIEEQADLFFRISEAYVDAAQVRDTAKVAVEEKYSIIADRLRRGFEVRKEKYTEGAIKEGIATSEEYLQTVGEHLDAKKAADRLQGMKDAVEQRGKMLRELAQLYAAGYYSLTSAKGTEGAVKDAAAAEGRRHVALARASRAKLR